MCHTIPIGERVLLEPVTLPLAEPLVTKLQIVELNAKDRQDTRSSQRSTREAQSRAWWLRARLGERVRWYDELDAEP